MTENRMNEIANELNKDEKRAADLLAMEPAEAAASLTAAGFTVTAEELVEFGEKIKAIASQDGELDDADLDNVAGGSVAGAVFVVGVIGGMILNKKNIW